MSELLFQRTRSELRSKTWLSHDSGDSITPVVRPDTSPDWCVRTRGRRPFSFRNPIPLGNRCARNIIFYVTGRTCRQPATRNGIGEHSAGRSIHIRCTSLRNLRVRLKSTRSRGPITKRFGGPTRNRSPRSPFTGSVRRPNGAREKQRATHEKDCVEHNPEVSPAVHNSLVPAMLLRPLNRQFPRPRYKDVLYVFEDGVALDLSRRTVRLLDLHVHLSLQKVRVLRDVVHASFEGLGRAEIRQKRNADRGLFEEARIRRPYPA